jgi:hypothetical protein
LAAASEDADALSLLAEIHLSTQRPLSAMALRAADPGSGSCVRHMAVAIARPSSIRKFQHRVI